jgi:hypothetical protein
MLHARSASLGCCDDAADAPPFPVPQIAEKVEAARWRTTGPLVQPIRYSINSLGPLLNGVSLSAPVPSACSSRNSNSQSRDDNPMQSRFSPTLTIAERDRVHPATPVESSEGSDRTWKTQPRTLNQLKVQRSSSLALGRTGALEYMQCGVSITSSAPYTMRPFMGS